MTPSKMTPEQLRIAVAEVLGWRKAKIDKASCGGAVYETVWFEPGYEPSEQTADWIARNGRINPPNYPSDLNACAEMEAFLRNNQFHYVDYPHQLFKVVTGKKWNGDMGYFFFNIVNASALDRCLAFLATIHPQKAEVGE